MHRADHLTGLSLRSVSVRIDRAYADLAETTSAIVSGHPNARLDELLPWAYPAATALKDVA